VFWTTLSCRAKVSEFRLSSYGRLYNSIIMQTSMVQLRNRHRKNVGLAKARATRADWTGVRSGRVVCRWNRLNLTSVS